MARKLTLVTDNNSPGAIRRKKSRQKRRLRQVATIGAIGVFLGALGYVTFADRVEKLRQTERQLVEYEKQYEQLKAQEEYYLQEISKLENEDYIALLARERYFKSEEGEIIFKLPTSSSEHSETSDQDETNEVTNEN